MKVVLAVSSYRGDRAVLDRTLEARSAGLTELLWASAVVDSGPRESCVGLRTALSERFPEVQYLHHPGNLGSAGNLVARMRWASSEGADVLIAVNADGHLDGANLRGMLACFSRPEVAAVYPTYVMDDSVVDLSGRQQVPVRPSRVPVSKLQGLEVITLRWGSSNGAMYRVSALEVVELERLASMWYGWEDLAVGLALEAAGYRQLLKVDATQPTASDQRKLSRTRLTVSDKPPWTTYYSVRNLLLLARSHPRATGRFVLRILREFVAILVRDRRRERYIKAMHGLVDGIRGRTGQVVLPQG